MVPSVGCMLHRCSSYKQWIIILFIEISLIMNLVSAGEVLWAVNCGGDEHTDAHGVHYQADPLDAGFRSDFGKNLIIQRVDPQDQILYQTERYNVHTFGYDVPIQGDGDYVIVLKFSEVWFSAPNQKVRTNAIVPGVMSRVIISVVRLLEA